MAHAHTDDHHPLKAAHDVGHGHSPPRPFARLRQLLQPERRDIVAVVVFAAAVPPYLLKSDDNPDGPLTEEAATEMTEGLESDRTTFFDGFTRDFFSAAGELKVTEEQRQEAIVMCHQSDQKAALGCMEAFGTTDFREDLTTITVPTLVIHGDSDATVPFEGSGQRTHDAISGAELADAARQVLRL